MQHIKLSYMEMVIHEMSSPVQTISLLSEVMLHEHGDSAKIKNENIQHIHYAAGKLSKTLALLSMITNSNISKISVQPVKLDLINLIEQEITFQQARIKSNTNLKINFVNEIQSYITRVDKFWFEQLLANLIINAVNHCEKGTIEICTNILSKDNKDYFYLSVSDEGCGIRDEELENIFLPLQRGTHSVGKIPGSGIGLVVVREVAEAHGGSVVARNNEKGGATFEVIIACK